jgi:hypothetical protein
MDMDINKLNDNNDEGIMLFIAKNRRHALVGAVSGLHATVRQLARALHVTSERGEHT